MKKVGLEITIGLVDVLNRELKYTESLSEIGRADQKDYGIEGQLLTLKEYTDRAISAWVNNEGPDQAKHELRKVAAIAIRALLRHGCPDRDGTLYIKGSAE